MGPEMSYVKGDGVNICVSEWPGPEPAVLAIHGLTANGRSFDTIARELKGGRRLLAMDLRGRGHSDKPPTGYSLAHHVADMAAVIDNLNMNKLVLMGHSLGAYVCLAFTHRYPELVDKLILIDAGGQLSADDWIKVSSGIKPSLDLLSMEFSSMDELLAKVRLNPFMQPWTVAHEDYYSHGAEEVAGGVRTRARPESINEERQNLLATDTAAFYEKVRCPVLVLRARLGMLANDDLVLPAHAVESLSRNLPTARLLDLDLNHFSIVFGENEIRAAAIADFLGA